MGLPLFCLLSPIITFLTHVLVTRMYLQKHPSKSPQNFLVRFLLFISLVYSLVCLFLMQRFHQPEEVNILGAVFTFVYVYVTTLGFGYGYFHFFNMSETARRIHILVLCFEANYLHRADAKIELDSYNANKMIKVRIDRLIQMGALELREDKFFTKAGGLAISGVLFQWIRPLFYPNASKTSKKE